MRRFAGIWLLGFSVASAIPVDGAQAAAVTAFAESAGLQQSTVFGIVTETFNAFPVGGYQTLNTAVGQLNYGVVLLQSNANGGAGGTGKYMVVEGYPSSTLTLTGNADIFGVWLSDVLPIGASGSIAFYEAGALVQTFQLSDLVSHLGSAYLGNPNSGADAGDDFVYETFTASVGTSFDTVILTGSDFGIDNLSAQFVTSVPEPRSSILLGSALAGLALSSAYAARTRRPRPRGGSRFSSSRIDLP